MCYRMCVCVRVVRKVIFYFSLLFTFCICVSMCTYENSLYSYDWALFVVVGCEYGLLVVSSIVYVQWTLSLTFFLSPPNNCIKSFVQIYIEINVKCTQTLFACATPIMTQFQKLLLFFSINMMIEMLFSYMGILLMNCPSLMHCRMAVALDEKLRILKMALQHSISIIMLVVHDARVMYLKWNYPGTWCAGCLSMWIMNEQQTTVECAAFSANWCAYAWITMKNRCASYNNVQCTCITL